MTPLTVGRKPPEPRTELTRVEANDPSISDFRGCPASGETLPGGTRLNLKGQGRGTFLLVSTDADPRSALAGGHDPFVFDIHVGREQLIRAFLGWDGDIPPLQ